MQFIGYGVIFLTTFLKLSNYWDMRGQSKTRNEGGADVGLSQVKRDLFFLILLVNLMLTTQF